MKRFLILNLLLALLLSSCSVITSSQTYEDGQLVDAPPTPEEVYDQLDTETPTEEVVNEEPIPVETGDYQSGGFFQNWIAFVDPNNDISIVNPVTGDIKQITQDASAIIPSNEGATVVQYSHPAWSSDGEYLAYQQEVLTREPEYLDTVINLWVYEFSSESSQVVLEDEILSGYSWKPDSHVISFSLMVEPGYFTSRVEVDAGLAHGIMQVDVKSGEISELVAPQGFSLVRPKWSPDGSIISFDEVTMMEGRGNFAWYELSTDNYFRFEKQIGNYDWSPEADIIAFDNLTYIPSGDERIMLTDRKGEQEEIFSKSIEEGSFASSPKYSPNGAQIAYLVGGGSLDQVDNYKLLVQLVDSDEGLMLLEGEQIETFSWSGDGSFLVASLGLYDSADIVVIDVLNETVTVVAQGWNPVWQK